MVAAVHQFDLHVHQRVTSHGPIVQCLAHSLFHRRDVLSGNSPALNGVHEYDSGAPVQGLQFQPYVAELAMTARLPDEPPFDFDRLGDRLPVRYAR